MKGKYWADHLTVGHIAIGGVQHSLAHLQPFSYTVQITDAKMVVTPISVAVEFSSHCVSKGPKDGQTLDFSQTGYEPLVIDHRHIKRRFLPARYEASVVLPKILQSLDERPCLFTKGNNFLTIEMKEVIPGYPDGTQYEVYFNVKQSGAASVAVYVESAFVRDEDADNDRYKFKKDDRIKGWRLLLNRGLGRPVKRPPSRR